MAETEVRSRGRVVRHLGWGVDTGGNRRSQKVLRSDQRLTALVWAAAQRVEDLRSQTNEGISYEASVRPDTERLLVRSPQSRPAQGPDHWRKALTTHPFDALEEDPRPWNLNRNPDSELRLEPEEARPAEVLQHSHRHRGLNRPRRRIDPRVWIVEYVHNLQGGPRSASPEILQESPARRSRSPEGSCFRVRYHRKGRSGMLGDDLYRCVTAGLLEVK